MPQKKRGSGQGKNQKTTRGRSPEREASAARAATPETFVTDATWVDMDSLDLDGKYHSFRPHREFMDAMVCDAKSWSETEDRSVIRTVAGAVANVVMPLPILVDFSQWRIHNRCHLRRLCGSRSLYKEVQAKFRSDTERIVLQLQERCV